jgi:regulatory protein
MEAFCAYQERSILEVKRKLEGLDLALDEREKVIENLIEKGFLNEDRFAESYVSGKFRFKKWGRLKIRQGLALKGVSKDRITIALKTIDSELYFETIKELAVKKEKEIKDKDLFQRKIKVLRFLASKGFEQDLCYDVVNSLFKEQ